MKSLYWPRGYQEFEASRLHENQHMKICFSAIRNATFIAQEMSLLFSFFTGCVDPRDIV